jgi:NADH-quinone oxidoreductase subunit J
MPHTGLLSVRFACSPLAQAALPLPPVAILTLCVVAGVGTVLILPASREAPWRKIGAAVLLAAGLIFAAILVRWTAGTSAGGMGAYFWIFSTIAVVSAIRVITHTRPVYSALYFVLTVFASAGLFLLMHAEFMAAALVLIYAGAILITYVFVIMLAAEAANPGQAGTDADLSSREPVAACAVGFAMMGVLMFVIFDRSAGLPPTPASAAPVSTTQTLGIFLFGSQVVALELAALLLTVAMVGAIVIARKRVLLSPQMSIETKAETILGPATPVDDDPHSIPVYGTMNPRQKAYPET